MMTIKEYTNLLNNPKRHELTWWTNRETWTDQWLGVWWVFPLWKHDAGLVFFVRNGYAKADVWVSFTVEDHPKSLIEFRQRFSTNDYDEISKLVAKNRDLIVQHANNKIGSFDLVLGIKGWIYEEMYKRVYQREDGIVWIGETDVPSPTWMAGNRCVMSYNDNSCKNRDLFCVYW